ncbi:hypothetical protein ABK040_011482 [Willaertia magna]
MKEQRGIKVVADNMCIKKNNSTKVAHSPRKKLVINFTPTSSESSVSPSLNIISSNSLSKRNLQINANECKNNSNDTERGVPNAVSIIVTPPSPMNKNVANGSNKL